MLETGKPVGSAIVIFGASGDLTARKLGPALYNLSREKLLPSNVAIVGYARTAMTDESFRRFLRDGVSRFSRVKPVRDRVWGWLEKRLFYMQGDYASADGFRKLDGKLRGLDEAFGTAGNRVFYLAIPPSVVAPVLSNLAAVGSLARRRACDEDGECYLRAVFEKPFGSDLRSAQALNNIIDRLLEEEQAFRMDHYLGKETVQNISVLRFANSIFEHLWHRQSVQSVHVRVAETLGVGGRGGYFDQTGILRDIMQNHVLQLLTLVMMEPPASLAADAIRDEKVKVLRCLRPLEGEDTVRSLVRGQYGRGTVDGRKVPAYREEDGVDPRSNTETFVALRTYVDNWRWAGVPVYLCVGKRLASQVTEVDVQFTEPPAVLFGALAGPGVKANRLKVRIQPDEGISLRFAVKVPGLSMELRNAEMHFPYSSAFPAASPEAYERLLLDVMAGNSALFARRDEVELAWRFASGIMDAWGKEPAPDFPNYRAGSWGPTASDWFLADDALCGQPVG
jgi:glucose-6-phosphate 1-dehydrogenase